MRACVCVCVQACVHVCVRVFMRELYERERIEGGSVSVNVHCDRCKCMGEGGM